MSIANVERRAIAVRGIVQGVGFRPFIYALARRHHLTGFVLNNAEGVQIEVEGSSASVQQFIQAIRDEAPPLALVETVTSEPIAAGGDTTFRIVESAGGAEHRALISPDVAICDACLAELFDPRDRRYRYPFINCTNCGPRFTITRTVPYDRAMTTMAPFQMCPDCQREYEDPANRRFHAQPNACPVCGPRVRLIGRLGEPVSEAGADPIKHAAHVIRQGAIVAVKGLGGYHLACDPFNADAVRALRERKVRQDKPFALMARTLEQVRLLCHTTPDEERLLTSSARPVVLLGRLDDAGVADEAAPRQKTLGVMLAYTPLHHVLLTEAGIPLIMTSGNRSDEPIAYHDDKALVQLGHIADYFLVHDRAIHMRCDDSVTRVAHGGTYPIRRSRGYAPAPLALPYRFARHTLACGPQLKTTFCVAKDNHAFVSHHIGDLENYETTRAFREGIEHFCALFDIHPALVAYDLHPEYLSTKYARELEAAGLPAYGIQHHHAHIASCLADNQRPLDEHVIGVAFDGTGYGLDGTIWGGEFLEGSIREGFIRRGHLECAPLPGGEAAIREPWRAAVAQLIALYGEDGALALPLSVIRESGERNVRVIARLVEHGLNTPLTSSAGRLFDTVAALVGVPGSRRTTYEGQAAVELELAASGATPRSYPFSVRQGDGVWVIETHALIDAVVGDVVTGTPPGEIASRFHRTMAELVVAGCERLRAETGISAVALSGGTFQNMLLLDQTARLLHASGFTTYAHRGVPANDGGISLGQAVLANSLSRD
jgi:hydrogenase maturation protein HypF